MKVSYRTKERIESERERREREAADRRLQWNWEVKHGRGPELTPPGAPPIRSGVAHIFKSDEERMREKGEREAREKEFMLEQGSRWSPKRSGWA